MKSHPAIIYTFLIVIAGTLATAQTADNLHGASFLPDAKLTGTSLAGFHVVGRAQWTIINGEITAKGGSTGGWLVSDKSYQDTGVYTGFKCKGTCDAGIALRLQKTANGMKGNFLSLKGDRMASTDVTIDSSGRLLNQVAVARAGATTHIAPQPAPPPSPNAQPPTAPPEVGPTPIKKPAHGIQIDRWNEVEALLDENVLRGFLNEGGDFISTHAGDTDTYGPFALYVGPSSEVHFKNVGYKDLAFKKMPSDVVGRGFRKQELSPFYLGWSADAADFNRDGKMDVVSGAFIYYGPAYTTRREIFPAETVNPGTAYITELFHVFDYTKDGWPDILSTNRGDGGAAGVFLYINPRGESRRWKKFKVVDSVNTEESVSADLDGDGIPEIIYNADGFMRYAKPNPADATRPWILHNVSEKGSWPQHAIGVGDINGDGKPDIVGAYGWWEQPASGLTSNTPWKYHEAAFGRAGRNYVGGAKIGVIDVNGDGLADVVASLEGHGWGLAWFEQKRSASGEISFVEHMVMDNFSSGLNANIAFSELHGADIADIDGDGIPDYVVGKRVYSHLDDFDDPDPYSGAYLYWFKTVRNKTAPGGGELEPHLIHNWSGAGAEVRAIDLNGDGKPEVITSTKLGTFVFWNEMPKSDKK